VLRLFSLLFESISFFSLSLKLRYFVRQKNLRSYSNLNWAPKIFVFLFSNGIGSILSIRDWLHFFVKVGARTIFLVVLDEAHVEVADILDFIHG